MKYRNFILVASILLFGAKIQSQYVYIPNNELKNYLLYLADENADGQISFAEAEAYKGDIYPEGDNLTGLEAFKNITGFYAGSNDRIQHFDFSVFTKLEVFNFVNSKKLKSLDVSKMKNLREVYIFDHDGRNKIKNLDFSNNKKIEVIRCDGLRNLEWINVANGANRTLKSFHFYGSEKMQGVIYDNDFNIAVYNKGVDCDPRKSPIHCRWIGNEKPSWVDFDVMTKKPLISIENDNIDNGSTAVFLFEGTKNTVIRFAINGGKDQEVLLDANGKGRFEIPNATEDQVLTTKGLLSERSNVTSSKILVPIRYAKEEVTVNVKPALEFTSIVAENSTICKNGTAIFKLTGTKNAIVTYELNGEEETITLGDKGENKIEISKIKEEQVVKIIKIKKGLNELKISDKIATITLISSPTAAFISPVKDININKGDQVTFKAKESSGLKYAFYVNNIEKQVKSTTSTFTTNEFNEGDNFVSLKVWSTGTCYGESVVKVTVGKVVIKPITLSLESNVGSEICKGDEVVFTATLTGGEVGPKYSFYVGGVIKQKNSSNIFKTTDLKNNEEVRVKVSGKESSLTVTVHDLPKVGLKINTDSNAIIEEDDISFTASGGTTYEFFVNGESKQSKSTKNTFVTKLNDKDKVKVKAWNTNNCSAETKESIISVKPRLSVKVEKGVPICEGVNGYFIIKGKPGTSIKYTFQGCSEDFKIILPSDKTKTEVEKIIISSKPMVNDIDFEYETIIIKEIFDPVTGAVKTDNLPVVTLDKFPNSIKFENSESDFTIKEGGTITFEATKHKDLIYAFYINGEKVQDYSKENTFTPAEELKDGYEVKLKVANQTKSCVSEISQIIHVHKEIGDIINPVDSGLVYNKVTIANGFSPNQDGINDLWEIIPNVLSRYPKNTLQVFNRSGNTVYKASPYNNDWDGVANSGVVLSGESKLPVGSYYFIFDTGKKDEIYKGWLYINY